VSSLSNIILTLFQILTVDNGCPVYTWWFLSYMAFFFIFPKQVVADVTIPGFSSTAVTHKDIRQKTVHRQESRGCGDLFIWFGGPLDKRFQGPFMCCLLLPETIACYWLLQWSNPVSIGSHREQTSFQSSSLYLWALGKHCFVKMSSSTLLCTVFLSNVFGSALKICVRGYF
jgi:hypothetical protein